MGNRWMVKERSLNRIDPAVALSMAIGAAARSSPLVPMIAMVQVAHWRPQVGFSENRASCGDISWPSGTVSDV
jgi:hypothetical protein